MGVSKFARNCYTGGSGANYAEITFNVGAQLNFAGI